MLLEPGETKYVVIALSRGDGNIFAISTNRTSARWQKDHEGEDFLETIDLPLDRYGLSVVFVWGGDSEFKKVFELIPDLSELM